MWFAYFVSEPPVRPPSMIIDKGALPKLPAASGKVLEVKPSIETDDHKAKNQEVKSNDIYRSGEDGSLFFLVVL